MVSWGWPFRAGGKGGAGGVCRGCLCDYAASAWAVSSTPGLAPRPMDGDPGTQRWVWPSCLWSTGTCHRPGSGAQGPRGADLPAPARGLWPLLPRAHGGAPILLPPRCHSSPCFCRPGGLRSDSTIAPQGCGGCKASWDLLHSGSREGGVQLILA